MPRLRTFGGLWIDDPTPGATSGPRPRPLGLLALLAAAGARGVTRERVLGVFWAESDGERARHALSQALYSLRRDVGADVVASTPDLRLRALIPSDVADFRDAVAAGRWADAAALYAGPFLDGFYLTDAPEFERWVEEERAALAADGHRALELAASEAALAGRADEARALWQRLARLDPLTARVAVACMMALADAGDRSAALAHGRTHVELLRRELDVEPDETVVRLMARLRDQPPAAAPAPADPALPAPAATAPTPIASVLPPRSRRRSRLVAAVGVAAGVLVAGALGWRAVAARPTRADAGGTRTAADSAVAARSPVAYRLYEEGLRAFHQFDGPAAGRLFRAALHEDSTFAMAAYYAWRAAVANAEPEQLALADRAVALAARAASRDSLLIVTHVGSTRDEVAVLATARALVERYPNDPEALVRATVAIPDLPRAIALLERAIALDSAAGTGGERAVCRLCEALNLLAGYYVSADSLEAAERTLGRWRAMRPADPTPWGVLAGVRLAAGRPDGADEAMRRFDALGGRRGRAVEEQVVHALVIDDPDAASAECDRRLATRDTAEFARMRWYCSIALRTLGRHREALALARRGPPDPLGVAVVALESGPEGARLAADELRARAQLFDTTRALTPGRRARHGAWFLTLAATADVAAGDTARAREAIDTIRVVGQRSLFPRDPVLHHFVRGLVLARAARHEAAARELRAAMQSPTLGYTRINYELGLSLLALGRPAEAIPVVRAALHGGVEGSGLYLTRTEAHELLARLFDAAGARDSAAAHYAVVERLWRDADPPLRARQAAAQERLRALRVAPLHASR